MIFKPQTFHGEAPTVEQQYPTEASLEEAAAAALAVTEGVDASDLKVKVTGGEIFLMGSVTRREEIDRAVETLLAVNGVEKVSVNVQCDSPL